MLKVFLLKKNFFVLKIYMKGRKELEFKFVIEFSSVRFILAVFTLLISRFLFMFFPYDPLCKVR